MVSTPFPNLALLDRKNQRQTSLQKQNRKKRFGYARLRNEMPPGVDEDRLQIAKEIPACSRKNRGKNVEARSTRIDSNIRSNPRSNHR